MDRNVSWWLWQQEAGTATCLFCCPRSCQPWHATSKLYTPIHPTAEVALEKCPRFKRWPAWQVSVKEGHSSQEGSVPLSDTAGLEPAAHTDGKRFILHQSTSFRKIPNLSFKKLRNKKICTVVTFVLQKVWTSLFQVWISLLPTSIYCSLLHPARKAEYNDLQSQDHIQTPDFHGYLQCSYSFFQGCFGCIQSPGYFTTLDHLLSVPMAKRPGRVTSMPLSPLALQYFCIDRTAHSLLVSEAGTSCSVFTRIIMSGGTLIRTADPHEKKMLKHKLGSFLDILKENWRNCTFYKTSYWRPKSPELISYSNCFTKRYFLPYAAVGWRKGRSYSYLGQQALYDVC